MINLTDSIPYLIWKSPERRARLLLRFAEVEADGGRDLVRAAETTGDPVLRGLFLRHAADEQHHAAMFRARGLDILRALPGRAAAETPSWLAPGERGLDDLRIEHESEGALLAFLHLSERTATRDFTRYIRVLDSDPSTGAVFRRVVRDESFHMIYTHEQLRRLASERHGWLLWQARLRRLWKLYLRLAGALAAAIGAVVLTVQYYMLLPPFAWLAKRGQRAEPPGWYRVTPDRNDGMERQY
jgi:hypothetical protein